MGRRCKKNDVDTRIYHLLVGVKPDKTVLVGDLHPVLCQPLTAGGNPVRENISKSRYGQVGTCVDKVDRYPGAPAAAAYQPGLKQGTVRCSIYRVMVEKVYVLVIADGRRDMQSLLQRRLLQA